MIPNAGQQRSSYVKSIEWPSKPSDLNPIKTLWSELKVHVAQQQCQNTGKQETFDLVCQPRLHYPSIEVNFCY